MESKLIDILNINSKDKLIEEVNKLRTDLYSADDAVPEINQETEFYAFFADPAEHSKSPAMYNSAFAKMGMNKFYFASKVSEGRIRDAIMKMRTLGIRGANISMPHKKSVMDELDNIDELAELCEAVNTIVSETSNITNNKTRNKTNNKSSDNSGSESDIILRGYNTDSLGAMVSIREMGFDINGKDITLLGLGGAGKAILAGLANEGARSVSIFVRNPSDKEHHRFVRKISECIPGVSIGLFEIANESDLKYRISESELLINCTSVGMGDLKDMSPIPDAAFLHKDLYVMDIIYSPEVTKLLEQAKSVGLKRYSNGLPMLLHQGEESFRLYTGQNMIKSQI